MSDNSERLKRLRTEIEARSKKDAEDILEAAKFHRYKILSEELDRVSKENNSIALEKVSEFENSERKRVSTARYAAERKVLLHRNSLVDGIFSEITEELSKFTASDKYADFLMDSLEKADKAERISEGTIVFFRPEDKETAKILSTKFPVKLEEDKNIILGGIAVKYPRSVIIDLTLDSALEAEREAFSARAEMQL